MTVETLKSGRKRKISLRGTKESRGPCVSFHAITVRFLPTRIKLCLKFIRITAVCWPIGPTGTTEIYFNNLVVSLADRPIQAHIIISYFFLQRAYF